MKEIYKKVIEYYGKENQIKKTIEELDELKWELDFSADHRSIDNIITEVSDVLNMIEQLKLIFNISDFKLKKEMKSKMDRTLERMK